MSNYGILLDSDPSKGPYEAGAWNALQQMEIPVSCVIGKGMNTFHGALLAQNDFQRYADFWQDDLINVLMQVRDEKVEQFVKIEASERTEAVLSAMLSELRDEQSDIQPLIQRLSGYLDEDRIRQSDAHFGIIVRDSKSPEEHLYWIDEIQDGKLLDLLLLNFFLPEYILHEKKQSSVSRPSSPLERIKERADKVLFFDEPAPELRRLLKTAKLDHKNLKPSVFLPPCSKFETEQIRKQMQTGTLDCLKAFGYLSGKKFFFNCACGYDLFNQFCISFGQNFENPIIRSRFAQLTAINENDFEHGMISYANRTVKKTMFAKNVSVPQAVLEVCGQKCQIDKTKIYTLDEFIRELFIKLEKMIEKRLDILKTVDFQSFSKKFDPEADRDLLNTDDFILLFARMTSPDQEIDESFLQKLNACLLPDDILALLGLTCLKLMILSL